MSAVQSREDYAALMAELAATAWASAGANWRRVKREWRKAYDSVMKETS